MKLREGFVTKTVADDRLLLSIRNDTPRYLIRLNETASDIVELLKNDVTEESIVEAMETQYDVSKETLKQDVAAVIRQLKEIDAIEES